MSIVNVQLAERISAAGTVLSHLYLAAPSDELRTALYSPEMLADWPLTDPDSAQGVTTLLHATPEDEDGLKRDHLYLFRGVGRPLAQPHESARVSREGLVFDEQTFEVRRAYAEFGFRAPNFNREPDDHIGLEIAFLANLAASYAERVSAGESGEPIRDAMRAFLFNHLEQFAFDVVDDVRKHAKTAAYKAVAEFTLGFLRSVEIFVNDADEGAR